MVHNFFLFFFLSFFLMFFFLSFFFFFKPFEIRSNSLIYRVLRLKQMGFCGLRVSLGLSLALLALVFWDKWLFFIFVSVFG